jgi:hypothetical protein
MDQKTQIIATTFASPFPSPNFAPANALAARPDAPDIEGRDDPAGGAELSRAPQVQRPHEALDMHTPSSCCESSPREMPNRLPPLEYPARFEVRYVSATVASVGVRTGSTSRSCVPASTSGLKRSTTGCGTSTSGRRCLGGTNLSGMSPDCFVNYLPGRSHWRPEAWGNGP